MKKIIIISGFILSSVVVCSVATSSTIFFASGNAPVVRENKTVKPFHLSRHAEKEDPGEYEKYTSEGNYFSLVIPKDWEKKEKDHPYGDLTKISGIRLIGPKNKDGVLITLSVLYYGGEGIFPNTDAFIRNRLNSMVRTDYDTYTFITNITTAGRQGKKFRIKTFEIVYLPLRDMPPAVEGRVYEMAPPSKKVSMIQQFIVIPAQKGFYVLNYGAPEDIAEKYRNVFEKVVGSFDPRLP